ncbi:unnamed protein product [marine sediment metagenome]|uniref:Uncharacterized protein n=1 Tax=marine sediment metagenome TaxID=412755 RepID=X1SIL1_9ZZZZ
MIPLRTSISVVRNSKKAIVPTATHLNLTGSGIERATNKDNNEIAR